jgi:hypothetical protein
MAIGAVKFDLTFITGDGCKTLRRGLLELIKYADYFDFLSAYFYITGFRLSYGVFETVELMRLLNR